MAADSPSIPLDWLALRFSYDLQALDRSLLRRALATVCANNEKPTLMDIGSGIGFSTKVWLSELEATHQEATWSELHWLLVDLDPILLDACMTHLDAWLLEQGWSRNAASEGVRGYTKATRRLTLEPTLYPLQALGPVLEKRPIDLITANAVFDLIDLEGFCHFADTLADHQVPFYPSLNYTRQTFTPESEACRHYLNLYDQHMVRPQQRADGPTWHSMGTDAPRQMQDALETRGFNVATTNSDWRIDIEDSPMALYLLKFLERYVPDLLTPQQLPEFQSWLAERRNDVHGGKLTVAIQHTDLFAHPTG